ncbi:MAG: cysteine desulfurase [Enterococcaceae bacterium]|jgi:cysteine desulfurase|nr:cysteine desulfurase [Enterococcaceae bacterium]
MIYFDNSATTSIDPGVLDTYIKTSRRILGNPSSLHRLGSQAARLLIESRKQIAEALGVKSQEIYFTSGGTEGDNWVLKGTAWEKRDFGNHLLISAVEHAAVKNTAKELARLGFEVEYLPVDASGAVRVEELEKRLRPETILVSVMAVNNEVGRVEPIQEISAVLEKYPKIHFHVDAVQALGKVPLEEWLTPRVDFACFSAHKFHGPKGVGMLYWKKGRTLMPLINGGGQENGQRGGTENVPGIAAMAKAVRLTMTDPALKAEHICRIRDYLAEALAQFPKVRVFSMSGTSCAPHIFCFGVRGVRGEVLVHAFEEKELFLSTTSACSSRAPEEATTLVAMGVPHEEAASAVRISLDEHNTMAEAEQFLLLFNQLYKKFEKIN